MRRGFVGWGIVAACTAAPLLVACFLTLGAFDPIPAPRPGPEVGAGQPQTFLLLGSDRRYGDVEGPRSDTIVLARLDPRRGTTSLLSVPRDLRVEVPGHGVQKVNSAYALGGTTLAVKTLRRLLGVPIHHLAVVDFGGFRRAIDRLGCLYADVDRRYFSPGGAYAAIDLQPGFQRLCGQDALDFARSRHADNDLVRGARQQAVLGALRDQVDPLRLLQERDELVRILSRTVQTDVRGSRAVLATARLVAASSERPVRNVAFPAVDAGPDLVAPRPALRRAVRRFLGIAPRPRRGRRGTDAAGPSGRIRPSTPGGVGGARAEVVPVDLSGVGAQLAGAGMRVRLPRVLPTGSVVEGARAYRLGRHAAYRVVVRLPGLGQYLGVQGTTWRTPPLGADDPRKRAVLRTQEGTYWVTNGLSQPLSAATLRAVRRSLLSD